MKFFDDGQVTLHLGHVLDVLRELPSESVQCVVTSPPYWALRAYGTEAQVWGGDAECEHSWTPRSAVDRGGNRRQLPHGDGRANDCYAGERIPYPAQNIGGVGDYCPCGAWRGELGHEPTPQMFVAHLVDIFREVRRVLKSDGVCFVNIGDSYSGSGKGPSSVNGLSKQHTNTGSLIGSTPMVEGTKAKDLVLIPERFAIAMCDDGWYVRSRIAWCKRAPMPESVKDRPTNAWEHIWMLTKSARYFWDADAVREPSGANDETRKRATYGGYSTGKAKLATGNGTTDFTSATPDRYWPETRNMWNYWLLSPDPEPLAHFATFPREIPRRCIAAATREGDTVLDPFVGSGTTTMVARSMLRRSIGIDLNEAYLRDIALKKNAQMAMMPVMPVIEVPA